MPIFSLNKKRGFIQHSIWRCRCRNDAKLSAGFTLIELLIYVGVLVLTLVVVIVAISSFARVYRRIAGSQILARSGATAMERIVREVRNAQSIDQTGSSFGAHPGRLTVLTETSPGVTTPSEFRVASGTIQLLENSVVSGSITDSDVTVENLTFYRIATPNSEAVRIILTLSNMSGTSTVTASFYDTALLRGSYPL